MASKVSIFINLITHQNKKPLFYVSSYQQDNYKSYVIALTYSIKMGQAQLVEMKWVEY
jgi:hypothetical protein